MTFYDITNDFTKKMEILAENADPDTGEVLPLDQVEEIKNAISTEVKEKSRNIIHVMKRDEMFLDEIGKEIKRLQEMKKAKEKALDRFKEYVLSCMESNGIHEIQTPIGNLKIRKSIATEIYDEKLIDSKYIKLETKEKISVADIKKALKAGENVQGARLIENYNLNIK